MDESTSITRTATLAGFTAAVATTHGVHLRDLAPMTTLHVHTRNSLYRIIVSAGDAVLVEGGEFFPSLTPAHFSGASVGGSFLKVGWIGIGLRMEILSTAAASSRLPSATSRPRALAAAACTDAWNPEIYSKVDGPHQGGPYVASTSEHA